MLHLILFQPEIPQNTGNIGRMCALAKCRLHLIHPIGFVIDDKRIRRSGMDYWSQLDLHHHANWEAFKASGLGPRRLFLFTAHAEKTFWDVTYEDEDGLVFGQESCGAPDWLHQEIGPDNCLKVPQNNPTLRSINLATCAGIATYEVMRQWR